MRIIRIAQNAQNAQNAQSIESIENAVDTDLNVIPEDILSYASDVSDNLNYGQKYTQWVARELWRPIKNEKKYDEKYSQMFDFQFKPEYSEFSEDEKKAFKRSLDITRKKASTAGELAKVYEEYRESNVDHYSSKIFRYFGFSGMSWGDILEWAEETKTNINSFMLSDAASKVREWNFMGPENRDGKPLREEHLDRQRRADDDEVVYRFPDYFNEYSDWKVVSIHPDNFSADLEALDLNNNPMLDYTTHDENSDIREWLENGAKKMYALVDSSGRQRASIMLHNKDWSEELAEKDPELSAEWVLGENVKNLDMEWLATTLHRNRFSGSENVLLKEWLSSLQEDVNLTVDFARSGSDVYEGGIEIDNMDEYGEEHFPMYNDYGLFIDYDDLGIGGDRYDDHFEEIMKLGYAGGRDRGGNAFIKDNHLDRIYEYAKNMGELEKFRDGVEKFTELAHNEWDNDSHNILDYLPPHPDNEYDPPARSDFIMSEEPIPGQTEFELNDSRALPIDEYAYKKALEEYDLEHSRKTQEWYALEEEEVEKFYPYRILGYLNDLLDGAKKQGLLKPTEAELAAELWLKEWEEKQEQGSEGWKSPSFPELSSASRTSRIKVVEKKGSAAGDGSGSFAAPLKGVDFVDFVDFVNFDGNWYTRGE
jgi:hypothetical protein